MFYSFVSMSGFGPFKTEKGITLGGGVTVISGENGSGKTMIFDAIMWALVGPKIGGRFGDDRYSVINADSDRAVVKLRLFSEDGDELEIKRTINRSGKHTLSAVVNGESTYSGINATQDVIDRTVGIPNLNIIKSASFMSASPTSPVSGFISGNSTEKRSFLASIVDSEDNYAQTNKVVKKAIREGKKDVSYLEGKCSEVVESISRMEANVPRNPERSSGELRDQRTSAAAEIFDLVGDEGGDGNGNERLVSRLNNDIQRIENDLRRFLSKNHEIEARIEQRQASLASERDAERSLTGTLAGLPGFSELEDTIRVGEALIGSQGVFRDVSGHRESILRDRRSYANGVRDLLKDSIDSGVCVVCGGDMSSAHSTLDHTDEEISSMDFLIDGELSSRLESDRYSNELVESVNQGKIMLDRRKSVTRKLTAVKNKIDEIGKLIEEDSEALRKRRVVTDKEIPERIEGIRQQIREAESEDSPDSFHDRVEVLKSTISKIDETLLPAAMTAERIMEEHGKKISESNEQLAIYRDQLDSAQRRLTQLYNLDVQTSPKGVISEDIEKLSTEISDRANSILIDAFPDLHESVSIVNSPDKDDLPNTQIHLGGRQLFTFSYGEQMRVIICISIAMTRVIEDRFGVWIPPMWDEPTLPIDGKFDDIVGRVIEHSDIGESEQVLIISRDSSVPDDDDDSGLVNSRIKMVK